MTSTCINSPFSSPFSTSDEVEAGKKVKRSTKADLNDIIVEEDDEDQVEGETGRGGGHRMGDGTGCPNLEQVEGPPESKEKAAFSEEETRKNFDRVTEKLWGKRNTRKTLPPELGVTARG